MINRYSSLIVIALLIYASPVLADEPQDPLQQLTHNQQQIASKEKEITELNKKIDELRQQRDSTAAQATVIDNQVKKLQQHVVKAELELKQISLSIDSVSREQKTTEKNISELEQQLNEKRQRLRGLIRALHEHEQTSLVSMFLNHFSLGAVLAQRTAYIEIQAQTIELMNEMRAAEESLQQKNQDLQTQAQQLQNLQGALSAQQAELTDQQAEQAAFLKKKKEEQIVYDHQLAIAKKTRVEIEQNIFTLKGAGLNVNLKLTDAKDMARYASQLTGVRAAILMGILKVESDVGNNVGNGHFPDDMHPASRESFLRLTKKLGLNPNTAPISARPQSYQGWGGAMGPGQFMPDTWERIESRLESLVKHTPNPYDLSDAFTATGMFLADKGATDKDKEYEAVNRYLAGPNWERFTWYGDRVLAVAKEYEKDGL